jgi:hypothetical protein
MPGVGELSCKTLRTWNGEQSWAFEELSYPLLAGTQAIRTGNADGGVEWYALLPDSIEWGWQAKHVEGIDALLTDGRVDLWAVPCPGLAVANNRSVSFAGQVLDRHARAEELPRRASARATQWDNSSASMQRGRRPRADEDHNVAAE